MVKKFFLVVCCLVLLDSLQAQENYSRAKKIPFQNEVVIDSGFIAPNSLSLKINGEKIDPNSFEFDYLNSKLRFKDSTIFSTKDTSQDTIEISYRIFPLPLNQSFKHKDTSQIAKLGEKITDPFRFPTATATANIFETGGVKKSGNISRGLSFGNQQDLGVNSSLNLQLSGYVAPNLQILASVTDNNLPIQPEGNTSKLQEFDQVFVQLFNDQFKITAGDFWLSKPQGYFLSYKKRAQGLTGEYYWKKTQNQTIRTEVSGALSKGKFNRQIIQGVEGNQGPYRLRGAENEPFILILAGTERVFIDGEQLERGQENDYVIDYNTSEVTFTARRFITKDSRIVVEFQYSDQSYARSLFQFSTSSKTEKLDWWVNLYSEQDAKNQTLQQSLNNDQKLLLSTIGDSLELARSISIDSVGFAENLIQYRLIDSLGYDSVLVFSVDPNLAVYRAQFSFVGANKGDYKFKEYTALGRTYYWVEPIAGIPQGDYAPVVLLRTPKKQQLVTAGFAYRPSKKWKIYTELGTNNHDLNTFSRLNSSDDRGYSGKFSVEHSSPFGKDSIKKWTWTNKLDAEILDLNFQPIEQFRAVEFDRDWNTRNQNFTGNQVYSKLGTEVAHKEFGKISLEQQYFSIGSDFTGLRSFVRTNWRQKGWTVIGEGSFLSSDASNNNQFIRHKVEVSKQIKKFRIGFIDDQEKNQFKQGDTLLTSNSYSFFDYQGYIAFGDSAKSEWKVFYRERLDGRSDSTRLEQVAKAKTSGLNFTVKNWKNQRITVIANYRELAIKNPSLISQTPENTTNGRLEHEWKALKNFIQTNTFYEVGSGLELKREFIYIKVNDGQGVYTWNDYNLDGIKDLNEFEVAAFSDQASYIRVFTPSNEYVKTYSNEFNQSITIRPDRIWSNKKGIKLFLSRFSTQSRFRIQRKSTQFSGWDAYNPFSTSIDEAALISSSSVNRQSVFFNRNSSVFGADYAYETSLTKTLLASGFDAKSRVFQELTLRWNITKKWSTTLRSEYGEKKSNVDYTLNRNYLIDYWQLKPQLQYQPNSTFRLSLESRIGSKKNAVEFGGESLNLIDFGIVSKINQANKGSFQGQVNYIQLNFTGNSNSPVAFELLEALKPGKNVVWTFGYQRTISKNLQLSIQYNGRKNEANRAIHAGGMELKAFF